MLTAGDELAELMNELAEPSGGATATDDLTSALVNAEVDGERLTDERAGSFFILLVVAGNETTRNAIATACTLLTEHPDQRAVWAADFDGVAPTAVEEIVRWATPVIYMRRTVTRRHRARRAAHRGRRQGRAVVRLGQPRRGHVRPTRTRFDVARDPNPHVGFGGPGPHFCLGAHLARREITVHVPRAVASASPTSRPPASPSRCCRTSSTASSTWMWTAKGAS